MESNLYPPLKAFLASQGYVVKGEIQECDVVAVRGEEEPVIVELKLSLNLDVVLQAVERLAATSKVYVGVPSRCAALKRRRRAIFKLFRRIGLGLLTIDPALEVGAVDVLLDPGAYCPRLSTKRQARLLGEFMQRVGDPNRGGADRRRGLMRPSKNVAARAAIASDFINGTGSCGRFLVAS